MMQPHDGDKNVLGNQTLHATGGANLEDRKPKRKVAVMIGYSGSGYKGMQMYGTSYRLIAVGKTDPFTETGPSGLSKEIYLLRSCRAEPFQRQMQMTRKNQDSSDVLEPTRGFTRLVTWYRSNSS